MAQKSLWREFREQTQFPSISDIPPVDVAIIGGGQTGVIAAYLLKDQGRSVALFEQGELGGYASGSTTAFLMETVDVDAHTLLKTRGIDVAEKILNSHRDAIRFYEEVAQRENIECEFMRCPLYKYALHTKEVDTLRHEVEALQRLGRNAQLLEDKFFDAVHASLCLPAQAKLHPLKFLFGLSEKAAQGGVKIYEHTAVPLKDIQAKHILMATHYPLDPQPPKLRFKKASYLTYVLEVHLPKGTLPEALFEDIRNPYHYLRVDSLKTHDRLLLGGADHRLDIPVPEEKNFNELKSYLRELLPDVDYTIVREWKGRIVEPGDGLAYLGPLKENIFYATGYSGNGLTYAVIAATLFRDWVLGKENPYQQIYAADRSFDLRAYSHSAAHYIEEFINGAVKNYFSYGTIRQESKRKSKESDA